MITVNVSPHEASGVIGSDNSALRNVWPLVGMMKLKKQFCKDEQRYFDSCSSSLKVTITN